MLFCTGASAISIVQLHAHEDSGFSIGGSWCVEESRIYTVQARSVCVCPSSSAPAYRLQGVCFCGGSFRH